MIDDTVHNRRHLPDPERCRTRQVTGYLAFTYCLVETPNGCAHAVRLGDDVLCRHPDRRNFENPRKLV